MAAKRVTMSIGLSHFAVAMAILPQHEVFIDASLLLDLARRRDRRGPRLHRTACGPGIYQILPLQGRAMDCISMLELQATMADSLEPLLSVLALVTEPVFICPRAGDVSIQLAED
ncbi:uncharacterized protein BXZ73DRAFT_95766 [Epithele typhae]|uniref:uncharacterized protein n=1 Tax=Epithele typhae TaxID=378194 RepID=UPI00200863B9|nr:uncharacterized protein BXZ73DRAFT_95766 [Epithele typhae]KAH9946264.1 hypothetical protein BXZ73DRAFT_95766 [Epithele typhae]